MRVVYSDVSDSGYGGSSVCTGLPECSTHFEGGYVVRISSFMP